MDLTRYTAVLAALSLLCACAGTSSGNPTPSDCAARGSQANTLVSKVLDQNLVCTTDADCTTIEFNNSCFDACSRAVSASGKAAVQASLASPEANDCEGCTVIAPPCSPPSAPACVAGRCQ